MKNIILFLSLSISLYGYSQETVFKFTKDGFTDFIVSNCENKTQSEIYKKTIDWISLNYKNPKEVIQSQIENEFIRFEGVSDDLVCANGMKKMCYTSKYLIEISIKEGRYKFDVISIKQLGNGNWYDVEINNLEKYYNKNGEPKTVYKYYPNIADFFNSINKSLVDSINSSVKNTEGW
jgi:hypothetical protein